MAFVHTTLLVGLGLVHSRAVGTVGQGRGVNPLPDFVRSVDTTDFGHPVRKLPLLHGPK